MFDMMSSESSESASSICQICFEEVKDRLALPPWKTGNGEIVRSRDCEHPICLSCMASFVSCRVQEQRVADLCCPAVGCKTRLYLQDVNELVRRRVLPAAVRNSYEESCSRDFAIFARELGEECQELQPDSSTLRLWENTRLCPKCSLAIERSEGCDSFYCICGHHFCFKEAPRPFGNGIRNYRRVIVLAQELKLSCAEAEKFKGQWRIQIKAGKTAELLGISREEALTLHRLALIGDEEAREAIQRARLLRKAALGGS